MLCVLASIERIVRAEAGEGKVIDPGPATGSEDVGILATEPAPA